MRSFYKWLENRVDDENNEIKEDYGIRHFLCADVIAENFYESSSITIEEFEEDNFEVLHPIFMEWNKTAKSFSVSQKEIDEYIKEHKAEMRMRAMESGYHNFVDDGERTYYW
jgi:hypothetical protein